MLTFFNFVSFFLLSSSMVPIGQRNSSIDYSVFRYVALLIREGKVLYRDVFDHKGPLLYFINYLEKYNCFFIVCFHEKTIIISWDRVVATI